MEEEKEGNVKNKIPIIQITTRAKIANIFFKSLNPA